MIDPETHYRVFLFPASHFLVSKLGKSIVTNLWVKNILRAKPDFKCILSKNSIDDKCRRNCGLVGDQSQTHISWDCPRMQFWGRMFWKDLKDILHNILKLNLSLEPLIFLLDIFLLILPMTKGFYWWYINDNGQLDEAWTTLYCTLDTEHCVG